MTVIVAGTVRAPAEEIAALGPPMTAMVTATRGGDGCLEYAYAQDLIDPGLIRIFEVWRDEAALGEHFRAPHMAAWRAATARAGVTDRALRVYHVSDERAL